MKHTRTHTRVQYERWWKQTRNVCIFLNQRRRGKKTRRQSWWTIIKWKKIICLYSFCFHDQHQYNVSGFACFCKESRRGQKKRKTKGKKNWTRSSIYTHTVEENKKEQKKLNLRKKTNQWCSRFVLCIYT